MTNTPTTMRVVSTDEASQGPFVVINAADFDPDIHDPYEQTGVGQDADSGSPAEAPRRRGRPRKQPNTEA